MRNNYRIILLSSIFVFMLLLSSCANLTTREERLYIDNLILNVNGYDLNLNLSAQEVWYDVETLSSDVPNRILAKYIPEGYIVKVNEIELESGVEAKIDIEHMSKEIGIPIVVQDMNRSLEIVSYIRTLNYDLPEYDYYVDESVEAGVYYTVLDNKWLVKWDNKKKEYIYFKNNDVEAKDFKMTEIDGKVFYSYFGYEVDASRPHYTSTIGYAYAPLFVMNDQYEIIDKIEYMSTSGNLKEKWRPEVHEHLIIGENHYLLMSYIPMYINNIPDDIPHSEFGSRVLAIYIQEVKNGELLWEWNSTEYPELYAMSVESNDWYNQSLQWNDYVHMNSMDIDPKDGNIICSCRNNNSIIKINKSTGNIEWVLGGNKDEFGLNEEQKFKRQHFAHYTEGGDIVLFDNQTNWVSSGYPEEGESDVGTGIPRVVRLKINEKDKRILSYSEFSLGIPTAEFMASAMLLNSENNTYIIGWGKSLRAETNAIFTEVNFNDKKILCEAIPTANIDAMTYRVYKFYK